MKISFTCGELDCRSLSNKAFIFKYHYTAIRNTLLVFDQVNEILDNESSFHDLTIHLPCFDVVFPLNIDHNLG